MNENDNPWQTLSTQTVYDNPWIEVTHREVINPSGGRGIYGLVHFKNLAVGVIPIDEQGHTWLVGQYRYPLNRYSWEIPEGGCPAGEDPEAAARRELLEETGLTTGKLRLLQRMDVSNSVSDEQALIYVAQDLQAGEATPEETEQLQVKRVPLQEAFDMVLRGEITDSLSVVGLLRLQTEGIQ